MSTLKELRDMIRWEAGIEGANTLIGPINKILNEILREHTALNRYSELYVEQASVASGGIDDYTFNLPSEVQHLVLDRVFFAEILTDGFDHSKRLLSTQNNLGPTEGQPRRFQKIGNVISVWPRTGTITASSGLFIDYYRYPTALSADSDQFPIPELEPTVRLETIARLMRSTKTAASREYDSDAARAFSRSKGIVK